MSEEENLVQKKKGKTGLIIGIAGGVVLLAAIVAVVLYFFVGSTARKVNKQLEIADKYLTDCNYEEAVLAYKGVLDLDPTCERAYIGLSDAYTGLLDECIESEDYDKAKAWMKDAVSDMENGVNNTESEEIRKRLEAFKNRHVWKDATCTEPKTCLLCDATEGEPLDHDWKFATLEAPKTCARCGETEGEKVVCKELKVEDYISDKVQGYTFNEETVVGYPNNDVDYFWVYDYDGNLLKTIHVMQDENYESWSFDIKLHSIKYNNVAMVSTYFDKGNNGTIILYNQFGEVVSTLKTKLSVPGYLTKSSTDDRYIVLCSTENKNVTLCIDTKELAIVDKADIPEKSVEYDEERFGFYQPTGLDSGMIFVSNSDKSLWGFVDKDLNEVKMYTDASNFNSNGYAFVSNDRKTYDIIDSDFNVVAKNYTPGESSWLETGSILGVTIDGEAHYYRIK